MPDNLFALLSYVLISTFTPGPNNISAASLGVVHGYWRTLRYQAGMAAGVWVMMLLAAWVSASLLSSFPAIEPALRWVGAAYVLYLAYSILKATYTFDGGQSKPVGFGRGFLLQLLNPKLVVYGLTLFATFLGPITHSPALLAAAALLAGMAFAATSTWALFGTAIKVYQRRPRVAALVNTLLALLLVYTAIELSGIL
ncbi:MAG TPA: LysE family transporter [Ramlibacter sp.]